MSQQRSVVSYLRWPLIITVSGLVLSAWLGWETEKTLSAVFSFLLVGTVLAALEIALSFDNAIVNANKLVEMTPVWRKRFLTWGILIAGFGMRIVFPVAIVATFAWIILLQRCTWLFQIQTSIRILFMSHTAQLQLSVEHF